MAERLSHVGPDQKAIFNPPRSRRITQNAELNRQAIKVALDKSVYPKHVSLEEFCLFHADLLRATLGNLAQRKQPLLAIMRDQSWPQYLCQFAGSIAASDIHLP